MASDMHSHMMVATMEVGHVIELISPKRKNFLHGDVRLDVFTSDRRSAGLSQCGCGADRRGVLAQRLASQVRRLGAAWDGVAFTRWIGCLAGAGCVSEWSRSASVFVLMSLGRVCLVAAGPSVSRPQYARMSAGTGQKLRFAMRKVFPLEADVTWAGGDS